MVKTKKTWNIGRWLRILNGGAIGGASALSATHGEWTIFVMLVLAYIANSVSIFYYGMPNTWWEARLEEAHQRFLRYIRTGKLPGDIDENVH